SQRRAKVEMTNNAPHGLPVLLVPGFIEAVFFSNDFLDRGRQRFLTRIKVAGGEFDQYPGDRDHDEYRRNGYQEASDNEPKHSLVTDPRSPRYSAVKLGVP